MVTLQQLTATTNAAEIISERKVSLAPYEHMEQWTGVVGRRRRNKNHSLTPRMLTSLISTVGAAHGAKNGSTT